MGGSRAAENVEIPKQQKWLGQSQSCLVRLSLDRSNDLAFLCYHFGNKCEEATKEALKGETQQGVER